MKKTRKEFVVVSESKFFILEHTFKSLKKAERYWEKECKEFLFKVALGNKFIEVIDFTQNNFEMKYKDDENEQWKSIHKWIEER